MTTQKTKKSKTENLGNNTTIGAAGGTDLEVKPKERKIQKAEIKLSVYLDGDTVLSAIGIPSEDTIVTHSFQKKSIKKDSWSVAEFLQNNKVLPHGTENRVIKDILNLQKTEVELPPMIVSKVPDIGNWKHEVVIKIIEL